MWGWGLKEYGSDDRFGYLTLTRSLMPKLWNSIATWRSPELDSYQGVFSNPVFSFMEMVAVPQTNMTSGAVPSASEGHDLDYPLFPPKLVFGSNRICLVKCWNVWISIFIHKERSIGQGMIHELEPVWPRYAVLSIFRQFYRCSA